jgi:hypothetical protein
MRLIALSALGALAGIAQAADVYRSVTEDGSVIYGDRPFGENVDVVHVTVAEQPGTAVPLTVAPVRQSASVSNAPTPEDDPADEMTNDQIRQRISENCELAKRQLAVVESTDDLLRTAADGTMERLTAEETVEVRALAAAEVDEWCESPASAAP